MNFLWDKVTEWLKELLIGSIMSNLTGLFDNVNRQVAGIADNVGATPQADVYKRQPIVLTTDANGYAETDWLDYGKYRVTESGVPAHYETSGFSTEIDCTENGKTYIIEVENEPTKGYIRVVDVYKRQLGGLLPFGGKLGVGMVEAALSAPLRPILPLGNMVALGFQQIDLVQVGLLAHFHDSDTEVPEHGRSCLLYTSGGRSAARNS